MTNRTYFATAMREYQRNAKLESRVTDTPLEVLDYDESEALDLREALARDNAAHEYHT